jgi:hypothetical protein
MRIGLGIAVVFYRWSAAPFRAYLPDDECGSGMSQHQQTALAKLKVFLFTEIGLIAFPIPIFPALMSPRVVFELFRLVANTFAKEVEGLSPSKLRRVKQLEEENTLLKGLVADVHLDLFSMDELKTLSRST